MEEDCNNQANRNCRTAGPGVQGRASVGRPNAFESKTNLPKAQHFLHTSATEQINAAVKETINFHENKQMFFCLLWKRFAVKGSDLHTFFLAVHAYI